MKALTLWVPHAVLIPFGWKEVETRDWYTPYRGLLAIHAAQIYKEEQRLECARLESITRSIVLATPEMHLWPAAVQLSLGCIVAMCTLAACVPTVFSGAGGAFEIGVDRVSLKLQKPFIPKMTWDVELKMGNYEPGRWAWILRDIVPVNPPIPWRGQRKLWEWGFPAPAKRELCPVVNKEK